ncbi:MAG: hypothetical protein LUG19_07395, partial [Desulfovibrio sp.]|uniref:hypothetical protein n=1 Tax=Desulfovibrio sp. TaxID=885 RepID=UPI00258A43B1
MEKALIVWCRSACFINKIIKTRGLAAVHSRLRQCGVPLGLLPTGKAPVAQRSHRVSTISGAERLGIGPLQGCI